MSDIITAITLNTVKERPTQIVFGVLFIILSIWNGSYIVDWSNGIMSGIWESMVGFAVILTCSAAASLLLVWLFRMFITIIRGVKIMTQEWLEDKMGVTALREKYERSKSDKAYIIAARQRDIEDARRRGYEEGLRAGSRQRRRNYGQP